MGRAPAGTGSAGSSPRAKAAPLQVAAAAPVAFRDAAERSVLGGGGDRPLAATWCSCRGCGDTARPRAAPVSRSALPSSSVAASRLHNKRRRQRPSQSAVLQHAPKAVEAGRAARNRREEVKQSGDKRRSGVRLARDHGLRLGAGQHKAKLLRGKNASAGARGDHLHARASTWAFRRHATARAHPRQLEDELPRVSLARHVCGGRVERVQRHLRRVVTRQHLGHQEAVRKVAGAAQTHQAPASLGATARSGERVRTAARSSRCTTGSETAATSGGRAAAPRPLRAVNAGGCARLAPGDES